MLIKIHVYQVICFSMEYLILLDYFILEALYILYMTSASGLNSDAQYLCSIG